MGSTHAMTRRERPLARWLLVGAAAGLALAVLDAVLNANPLARRLYEAYRSIARPSLDPIAGLALDVAFGLVMAALFLRLAPSLPGRTRAVRGLSFGVLAWFFRGVMPAAATSLMFTIPPAVIGYQLAAGLLELSVLGLGYGLALGLRAPGRAAQTLQGGHPRGAGHESWKTRPGGA